MKYLVESAFYCKLSQKNNWMKNFLFKSLICLLIVACSKSNVVRNNPNLPNYSFDTGNLINTNLPEYSNLQFAGNHVILNSNYGINGVVVYNSGTSYTAFELTDPNHSIQNCSNLAVQGVIATCSCDDGNSYEILSGQGQEGTTGQYLLKPYFVEVSSNIIRVYNN